MPQISYLQKMLLFKVLLPIESPEHLAEVQQAAREVVNSVIG